MLPDFFFFLFSLFSRPRAGLATVLCSSLALAANTLYVRNKKQLRRSRRSDFPLKTTLLNVYSSSAQPHQNLPNLAISDPTKISYDILVKIQLWNLWFVEAYQNSILRGQGLSA